MEEEGRGGERREKKEDGWSLQCFISSLRGKLILSPFHLLIYYIFPLLLLLPRLSLTVEQQIAFLFLYPNYIDLIIDLRVIRTPPLAVSFCIIETPNQIKISYLVSSFSFFFSQLLFFCIFVFLRRSRERKRERAGEKIGAISRHVIRAVISSVSELTSICSFPFLIHGRLHQSPFLFCLFLDSVYVAVAVVIVILIWFFFPFRSAPVGSRNRADSKRFGLGRWCQIKQAALGLKLAGRFQSRDWGHQLSE